MPNCTFSNLSDYSVTAKKYPLVGIDNVIAMQLNLFDIICGDGIIAFIKSKIC